MMTTRRSRARMHLTFGALLTFASLCAPSIAHAADEPARQEDPVAYPAAYPIEIEPHLSFGAANVYGAAGFGAGLRASVPLVTGHLGRVPDNLAISFGGDLLHYENCYFRSYCGANYLLVPVAAQWNIFVARKFSLFGEGGVFLYKGWRSSCRDGDGGCNAPSDFGVLPTIALGGRFHLGDHAALTMRLGYPTITLGVSFL